MNVEISSLFVYVKDYQDVNILLLIKVSVDLWSWGLGICFGVGSLGLWFFCQYSIVSILPLKATDNLVKLLYVFKIMGAISIKYSPFPKGPLTN